MDDTLRIKASHFPMKLRVYMTISTLFRPLRICSSVYHQPDLHSYLFPVSWIFNSFIMTQDNKRKLLTRLSDGTGLPMTLVLPNLVVCKFPLMSHLSKGLTSIQWFNGLTRHVDCWCQLSCQFLAYAAADVNRMTEYSNSGNVANHLLKLSWTLGTRESSEMRLIASKSMKIPGQCPDTLKLSYNRLHCGLSKMYSILSGPFPCISYLRTLTLRNVQY